MADYSYEEISKIIDRTFLDASNIANHSNDYEDLCAPFNEHIVKYAESNGQTSKLSLKHFLSESIGNGRYYFVGLKSALKNMRMWRNNTITDILRNHGIVQFCEQDNTLQDRLQRERIFNAYFHGLVNQNEAESWKILSGLDIKKLP